MGSASQGNRRHLEEEQAAQFNASFRIPPRSADNTGGMTEGTERARYVQ